MAIITVVIYKLQNPESQCPAFHDFYYIVKNSYFNFLLTKYTVFLHIKSVRILNENLALKIHLLLHDMENFNSDISISVIKKSSLVA